MVAEQARGAVASARTPPPLRVRGRDGRWYVLHSSLMRGKADGAAAVVIARASPADIMPVVFASYALTLREFVAQLLTAHPLEVWT